MVNLKFFEIKVPVHLNLRVYRSSSRLKNHLILFLGHNHFFLRKVIIIYLVHKKTPTTLSSKTKIPTTRKLTCKFNMKVIFFFFSK